MPEHLDVRPSASRPANAAITDGDWAVQTADTIERLVGSVRSNTSDRLVSAARLVVLVERLSTGILDTFHTELGDRFENPTADDLRDVIDAVVAHHPAAGVRCTLSWVVEEGMPAAEAARDVLLSEPRLRLPGWAEAS